MDLAQHAAVLWRFRAVVAGGLVLGIVLAVLAAYQLPSLTPRGSETWTSESSLLVTQAGFPEGRPRRLPTDGTGERGAGPAGRQRRPARVRRSRTASPPSPASTPSSPPATASGASCPGAPRPAQIQAIARGGQRQHPASGHQAHHHGGQRAAAARALNVHTVQALTRRAQERAVQERHPGRPAHPDHPDQRSGGARKTAGRSHTASILALLLCVLGAVALAHLLAALRDGREDMESLDGVVVPWAVADERRADRPDPWSRTQPMAAARAASRLGPAGSPAGAGYRELPRRRPPRPGVPGRGGRSAEGERASGSPWASAVLVVLAAAAAARAGQPDPRRGRRCRWCSWPTAHAARVADACSACSSR